MDDLIYLEVDEEITSVIDRLKKNKGSRLGIVVPRGAMVLQSVVNLKLIEREAEKAKKKVAIITSDKVGRSLAMQVGVPVFDDAKQAEIADVAPKAPRPSLGQDIVEIDMSDQNSLPEGVNVHYYNDEPKTHEEARSIAKKGTSEVAKFATRNISPSKKSAGMPNKNSQKKKQIKIIAVLLSIALCALGLWIWFLKAEITITIPADTFDTTATVTVDSTIVATDASAGKIKGDYIEVEKEFTKDISATGTKETGDKSSGTLTFYNGAGIDQTIASQTVLTSDDGKKFTLDSEITVPKATLDAGGNKVQGKASGKVTAKEAGTGYNMSSSTSYTVAGNSIVTAQGETSGGTSKQVKIISISDLEGAKDKLAQDAPTTMKPDIEKQAGDKYILDSAIDYSVNGLTSSKNIGDEVDKFTVKAKVIAKTIVFLENDLRQVIAKQAETSLPEGKSLLSSDSDTIQPELKKMDMEKREVLVLARLFTHIGQAVETSGLAQKTRLKSVKNARATVANQTGLNVEDVAITLKPNLYWLRMPILDKNTKIKFNYSGK